LVGGIQPNQIENDLLEEGKILWGVVFTYGAGILAEADAEHPVKPILDGPMASHGKGKSFGGQLARADVSSRSSVPLSPQTRRAVSLATGS